MDWENLRFFLAVANTGSLAGAGRQLGVIHTTVMRRIASLEKGLGSKLFERHPGGYALTAAGHELKETLLPFDAELTTVERRLSGLDQQLTGTVRVATLGPLSEWVCQALAKLRAANPEVTAEVIVSTTTVSLARHEADIAVRVSTAPPEYLVGRRIAALAHGVYAARHHPATIPDSGRLADHTWLSYTDARRELPQARWVAENVPDARIVMRTNHTKTLLWAVRSGLGLAVLPCYQGDREPGLRRLETLRGFGQNLWILVHQDLRRNRRIQILMTCLADELMKYGPLIEGHQPHPD